MVRFRVGHFFLLPLLFLASSCTLSSLPARPENQSTLVENYLGNFYNSGFMLLVLNEQDPISQAVEGAYNKQVRSPTYKLSFSPEPSISLSEFRAMDAQVKSQLRNAQVIGIGWQNPYRVVCPGSCMEGNCRAEGVSITTAFAYGPDFVEAYCNLPRLKTGCRHPEAIRAIMSPGARAYFGSRIRKPKQELGLVPSMMISAGTPEETAAMLQRGFSVRAQYPTGKGYLMRSGNWRVEERNPDFQKVAETWDSSLNVKMTFSEDSQLPEEEKGLLFYFTGTPVVPENDLKPGTFAPGAVADNLTSLGGDFSNPAQTKATRFLQAGASGSYGTVIEPCAYSEKFPDVSTLLSRYYAGDTLIEAYWKSVETPAEGLFIGDPLAQPWGTQIIDASISSPFEARDSLRGYDVTAYWSFGFFSDNDFIEENLQRPLCLIRTTAFQPGSKYRIEARNVHREDNSFEQVIREFEVADVKLNEFNVVLDRDHQLPCRIVETYTEEITP